MRNIFDDMKTGIINGWYPLIEKVMPRVYHRHLAEKEMENIYGCKCFGKEECTHVENEEAVDETENSEDKSEDEESTVNTLSEEQKETGNAETPVTDDDPQQPTT